MRQILDRETLDSARDSLATAREGLGDAWRKIGKVEFRKPWVYRKSVGERIGSRPWLAGILILTSVLAAFGAILYFRKRKQVSDRYNMGESDTTGEIDRSPFRAEPTSAPRREESLR